MKWIPLDNFEEDELVMAGGENLNKIKGFIIDEFSSLMGMLTDFIEKEKQKHKDNSKEDIKTFFDYIIKNRTSEDFEKEFSFIKEKFCLLRKIRNDLSHGCFFYDYRGNLYLVNKKCLLLEDSFEKKLKEICDKCFYFLVQMQEEYGHYDDL